MNKPTLIEIFTDGACRGNPGPGGWGALLRYGQHEKTMSGSEAHTTNNRMELQAVIMALKSLTRPCHIVVTTDSQYVRNGMMHWLKDWKKRGWKTASRTLIKNVDLWQTLDKVIQPHQIQWEWVKGHSGHHENELVDQLANKAIDAMLKGNKPCDKLS